MHITQHPPAASTITDAQSAPLPRVLSFGGGVQSSALLALLGSDRYPGERPEEVWFCDPGSERPETYAWIEETIRPYCATIDLPFIVLQRHFGTRGPDLMAYYQRTHQYPLRTNRQCTIEWKVNVVKHECERRAWPAWEMHLGISIDELHRARTSPDTRQATRYPLIDRRLNRTDCQQINQEIYGSNPIKSGCWFCKYQRPSAWREVYDQRTDGRWQQAVIWEQEVMARHGSAGAFVDARIDGRNLTLDQWAQRWALGQQLPLVPADDGACDGGYCMV